MNLTYWLRGYRRVTVCADHAADLLELCRRRVYPYDGFVNHGDGSITLCFAHPTVARVLADGEACGIPLTVTGGGGLPDLCMLALHRAGITVGLLLGVILLVVSQFFVWDIRVSGNVAVSDREVKEALAACGFEVGTCLRDFRADRVENRVLMGEDRLAWISINMKGTVAYVQVREAQRPPEPPSDAPANVVAARSGVIQWIRHGEGNLLVAAGDSVSEGDLLVSGLYDSVISGFRYTRASAAVYAKTVRELTVTVPLSHTQKVYIGDDDTLESEKSLIFFGKSLKFSKSTGNVGGMCDTIEQVTSMGLWDGVGFPVAVRRVWHMPYTYETVVRTPAEAEELAYLELARQIGELPGDAQIIKKTVRTTLTDTELHLTCILTIIEDIARVVEFEVME